MYSSQLALLLLLPLFSLVAPLLLWPIELFLPYPYVIEELAKAVFVLFLLRINNKKNQIYMSILLGALFALSETALYITNILLSGNTQILFQRLVLTIPLHVLTLTLILILGQKNKWLILLGLLISGLIHYYFNILVATI